MFYSHHLLARKAPLGQICDEILNPSVPMALRLSGILMEDVTRLLVELNEAWKVKAKRDPTILPKGKSQANSVRYEAVTLPDNEPADLGEFEQHLQFSNSETLMGMHKSAYIDMNFDNIDDSYISHNHGEADLPHDNHQADVENITLYDRFDSYQTDARHFNRFERFDIEGDDLEGGGIDFNEEIQEKFPSHNHTDLPDTLVPSPPVQEEPQNSNEIHEQPPEHNINHQSEEDKVQHGPQKQRPSRKRARRRPSAIMDYEQTMIPGHMYQSWLQDASDIVSRKGRKKKHVSSIRSIKIERLMDLPPVALVDGLFTNGNRDIYYPLPLLKQWMKLTQPLHDIPSGQTTPPHPPPPSSSPPPPEANNYHDQTTLPFEDHNSGVGSGSLEVSVEKGRSGVNNHEMPFPPVVEPDMVVTPANSGGQVKSMNSESGPEFMPQSSDINSGRSNKKRLFSSIRKSGSSLEPLAEELLDQTDPNFKLAQLSEMSPETNDLIVETGPTQTQKVPVPDQPMEHITDSIRMQLKTHFDTPGYAQTESLDQIAFGLIRKRAACLFYHTCVLASRGYIKNSTALVKGTSKSFDSVKLRCHGLISEGIVTWWDLSVNLIVPNCKSKILHYRKRAHVEDLVHECHLWLQMRSTADELLEISLIKVQITAPKICNMRPSGGFLDRWKSLIATANDLPFA
ncbi:hypothetical protein QVD17_31254 [Tagetes erecta]|uniref:Rad21/Rec8-like protein C-terminal eukaryotic domain-containing protein n=1 Tax=Tagetes erecta TaxID=13708 RepID=A0AAD8NNP9_TARER|nr:hypothetical protein QVD17_31254 [Tagetes erecta]